MKNHTSEEIPSGPEAPATPGLPPLHCGVLDLSQVEQLFTDIEVCAGQVEVLPKYDAQVRVGDSARVTLQQGRELLATGAVRGLQIRYQYDGADWWDTLLRVGDRFRVVRIRHEFPVQP